MRASAGPVPGRMREPSVGRDQPRAGRRGRVGPDGAHEAERGGAAGEAADAHERAGVRGLDDRVAAEVHRDVARPVDLRLEEHEVAGLELATARAWEDRELRGRVVRQRDAELPVHELHQAGAVEAARRARAAPDVRRADEVLRDRDGGRAVDDVGLSCSHACEVERHGGHEARRRREERRRPRLGRARRGVLACGVLAGSRCGLRAGGRPARARRGCDIVRRAPARSRA